MTLSGGDAIYRRLLGAATIVAAAALLLAACSSSTPTAKSSRTTRAKAPATVDVANLPIGRVLVDSQGKSLYYLTADTGTARACNGGCLSIWPPLVIPVGASPVAGAGIQASLLSSRIENGQRQVTYAGHLLYRYSGDLQPGQYNGEALAFPIPPAHQTGTWWLITPEGAAMFPKAGLPPGLTTPSTAPPHTSTPSSGPPHGATSSPSTTTPVTVFPPTTTTTKPPATTTPTTKPPATTTTTAPYGY